MRVRFFSFFTCRVISIAQSQYTKTQNHSYVCSLAKWMTKSENMLLLIQLIQFFLVNTKCLFHFWSAYPKWLTMRTMSLFWFFNVHIMNKGTKLQSHFEFFTFIGGRLSKATKNDSFPFDTWKMYFPIVYIMQNQIEMIWIHFMHIILEIFDYYC